MLLGWLPFFLSILLNILVVYFLIKTRRFEKYAMVAFFCLAQATIVGIDSYVSSALGGRVYAITYWTCDLVAHLFITLVIVGLVRLAVTNDVEQRLLPLGLLLAMLALAAYSLYVFHDRHNITRWINPVSRNLSVGEEALNLILWSFLLQKRDFDSQLIIISSGIGIQVTGEVIGLTLRPYTSYSMVWVPNLLVQSCEFLCLLIWVWAFSPRKPAPSSPG